MRVGRAKKVGQRRRGRNEDERLAHGVGDEVGDIIDAD